MNFLKSITALAVGIFAAVTFSVSASAAERAEIGEDLKCSSNSITVSFNAHTDEDEAVKQVYVFANGEGREADPTKNSFTVTDLEPSTKYQLAIMTIIENSKTHEIRSSLSDGVVCYTHPSETSITSHIADSQSISLIWKKVENADGYIVYRKSSDGTLTEVVSLEGSDNVKYVADNLKRVTSYTYVVKTYKDFGDGEYTALSSGVSVTEKTLDHPEAPTSKDKPGLVRLNKDMKTIPDKNGNFKMLRKGIYTGYRVNDSTYMIACGYGEVAVAYDDSSLDVMAVSSNANSILSTGAISQLGEGTSHPNGCGPTAATIIMAHELFIPNGDAAVSKNTVISNYRYDSRVGKFSYGQYWCVENGTALQNGVKVILDDYAKQYGKKAVYFDTAKITGATYAERQSKLIAKIDSELAAGHRVLACVKHTSDNTGSSTKHDYLGEDTHYIVICGETGGEDGKYYIADPLYSEKSSYPVNKGIYYYGLEERSKSHMAQSIMAVNGEYLIRGLVFIS